MSDATKYCRAWTVTEEIVMRENAFDTKMDLSLLLSRPIAEIKAKRRSMGLLDGRALDVARKQVEENVPAKLRRAAEGNEGDHVDAASSG